jgi:glycerol kinase
LVLDPYFSGTKLAWLYYHHGLQQQVSDTCFGTMDTWLLWNLTAGEVHATDVTNASRTMMFDIHALDWDGPLLEMLGSLPRELLPAVRPSACEFGRTKELGWLPDGVPIVGIAGDQHAALFGQACFTEGMAKCTYGTGAFAVMNTGSTPLKSKHQLLTTIAWQIGDTVTYALEGSAFVAGAVVQWLRDGLQIIESSSEIEELASSVPDSGGVVLVPALTGLGAPHWRPEARGIIDGISRGTTKAHIARAALEGVAFEVYDLLRAMEDDAGRKMPLLRVDGGASANNLLIQYQADILGVPIHRPSILETTAMGAAYLGAFQLGVFDDLQQISMSWRLDQGFTPSGNPMAIDAALQRWHAAIAKA